MAAEGCPERSIINAQEADKHGKPLTRVYYYRGGVERACTQNGRPSYRWHDGYSANSDDGKPLYPWQTQKECRAEAKRDGVKAVFEKWEESNRRKIQDLAK